MCVRVHVSVLAARVRACSSALGWARFARTLSKSAGENHAVLSPGPAIISPQCPTPAKIILAPKIACPENYTTHVYLLTGPPALRWRLLLQCVRWVLLRGHLHERIWWRCALYGLALTSFVFILLRFDGARVCQRLGLPRLQRTLVQSLFGIPAFVRSVHSSACGF